MGSRHRTRDRATVDPGNYQFLGSTYYGASGVSDHEICDDTTMPRPYTVDHTLSIIRRRAAKVQRLSGETGYFNPTHTTKITYNGYNPQNRSLYQYAPNGSPIDWLYWKTKALANMDPFKPDVSLPLFLFEFKDFPRMLRHAGRVLSGKAKPSDVPGGWLAYSFGWAPLVSDLLSLMELTKSIDDRVRYFKNLERGSMIRRKLTGKIIADSTISDWYQLPIYTRTVIKADKRDVERLDVWFSANGKAKFPLPNDPADLRLLSTKAVLGLKNDPASLWDFLPWSWLIDYFLNVGDYLRAHQGLTHMMVTRMCLMAKVEVNSSLVNIRESEGITTSPSVMLTTSKQRSVFSNPTPFLYPRPFLGARQIGNLASLVTAAAFKAVGK